MILAAALLVLIGLGLFVGGIVTQTTLYYWLCVGACVLAGVFLLLARSRMGRAPAAPAPRAGSPEHATRHLPTSAGASDVGSRRDAQSPGGPDAAPAARTFPVQPAAESVPGGAPAWERTTGRAGELVAAPIGDPVVPPVAGPVPAGLPAAEPAESPSTGTPEPPSPEPPAAEPTEPPSAGRASTGTHAARAMHAGDPAADDPPVEEVEVTDLLLVVDLRDEVLVVDEHPRYHLGGCRWLSGRQPIPLPLDEARTDGFTPCGWCAPDRSLAERERARRAGRQG